MQLCFIKIRHPCQGSHLSQDTDQSTGNASSRVEREKESQRLQEADGHENRHILAYIAQHGRSDFARADAAEEDEPVDNHIAAVGVEGVNRCMCLRE